MANKDTISWKVCIGMKWPLKLTTLNADSSLVPLIWYRYNLMRVPHPRHQQNYRFCPKRMADAIILNRYD